MLFKELQSSGLGKGKDNNCSKNNLSLFLFTAFGFLVSWHELYFGVSATFICCFGGQLLVFSVFIITNIDIYKNIYVAVTVPRVSHLIICTSRVPSSKDMCFSRVLTGVSILHPENCVWLLLACRWWQEKCSQLSQSYWRPRGPGLCRPPALWWAQGGESKRARGEPGKVWQREAGDILGFWMPHTWPLKYFSAQIKCRTATQSLVSYENAKIGAKRMGCSINYASREVALLVSSESWLGALLA